jgi:ABC-2 type transport system permease protein
MQTRRAQRTAIQFVDLLRIELTNWRWTWRPMIVLGTVAPFGAILAMRFALRQEGPAVLEYVFAGNLALSLIFDNQMRVGTHFQFMRFHGTFDYFAALPVSKSALVLAVASAFFILSLPSVLVLTVVGPPVLGLSLHPTVGLLPIIPLCAISLSGIGALVGLLARTPAEATSITMLVTLLLAGGALVPPSFLPAWAALVAPLSPSTHAASALRQTLFGPVTNAIWLNVTVLSAVAGGTFWAVARKLDWRDE